MDMLYIHCTLSFSLPCGPMLAPTSLRTETNQEALAGPACNSRACFFCSVGELGPVRWGLCPFVHGILYLFSVMIARLDSRVLLSPCCTE